MFGRRCRSRLSPPAGNVRAGIPAPGKGFRLMDDAEDGDWSPGRSGNGGGISSWSCAKWCRKELLSGLCGERGKDWARVDWDFQVGSFGKGLATT